MADEVGVVPGSSPGIMNSIGNVLQNKLLLQYLSGVGGAMSAGQPVGPAMNAITQQNIQSQNMMKLMSRLLGPDGTKATFSNAGMNLTVPSADVSKSLQGTEPGGVVEGMAAPLVTPPPSPTPVVSAPAPVTSASSVGGGSVAPNPFAGASNLDLSPSDLAGLTPQDISVALGMKMNMENVRSEIKARENKAINPEDMTFPVLVPSIGSVSLRQWSALPKKQQEYAAYVHSANQSPNAKILTAQEFDSQFNPTERENFLRAAIKDPKLMAAAERLAKAGATTIGGEVEKKKAMNAVEAENYFSSGEFNKDLDKKVNTFREKELWQARDTNGKLVEEKDRPRAIADFKVTQALDELAARGYTVTRKYWLDAGMTTAAIDATSKSGNKETIKIRVK